jgi:hypothetical protein
MPPIHVCIHCGVRKQFNEMKGVTVFIAANGWVYGAAEPQCRREIFREGKDAEAAMKELGKLGGDYIRRKMKT